ncbi:cell wall anchored protein [Diplodia corticola]|uniref:Cell wall anchored protein n=1 Tax=Diplodia corticola TaxID=236234 RepID=A0A1J9R634_9PEZI|nr:cell wall anchored protein [Diplodia corticola]OJD36009.1 cell wall anchored protein [Diplodia corticola]
MRTRKQDPALQASSDASKIYTYGGTTFLGNTSFPGWTPAESDTYSLWSYDTSTHAWDQYDITKSSPLRPNRGSSAEAPALGLSFYLNGQIDAGSSAVAGASMNNDTEFLDGMIVLDTVNVSSQNLSTATLGNPRVAGGLQFIEAIGERGALVAIGGLQRSGNQTDLIAFDHAGLCDDFTATSTWHRQSVTGDIPPPRSDFCIVAASAPDNSSHNIYLYGGIDPSNATAPTLYDDIHILSLPSFTWTRVYAGESPRWGHTCHLAGPRQMLTVGGTIDSSVYDIETQQAPQNINTSALACDWEAKGVAVLDMSTLKWGSVFDFYGAAYRVPRDVVAVVGGGEDGGATATAPAGGFAEGAVASMFSSGRVGGGAAATTTSAAATRSGSAGRGSSAGTVAGAVVGGVVGVGILLGGWRFCVRLRKRRREVRGPMAGPAEGGGGGGEEEGVQGARGHRPGVGTYVAEAPDAARYELYGRSRIPEMTGGSALAHELQAIEEPGELAGSHGTFELSTGTGCR